MKKLLCVCFTAILVIMIMGTFAFAEYEELQKGSKGDAVAALQTRLNELNYSAGKVDGSYGKGTAAAVKEFQQTNELEATALRM